MSVKPSASAAIKSAKLARPGVIARRARRLAARYRFLVEPEGKRFVARPMEYPEVIGVGTSPEEALREALALATTAVAVLLESRRQPPLPCAD